MPQLIEHADGVYLNLREDVYHADWALGSTAIKTLHSSPPDWWWGSPFNELIDTRSEEDEEKAKEKKAQAFGTALHVILLEGVDVFNQIYGVAPSKYSHPKALDTLTELKDALKAKGEKVSGNKPELIERLRAVDPDVEILELIVQEWLGQGKRPLSRGDYNKLRLMERLLLGAGENVTQLGKAFQGGLSEVSVFWTDENGIRQKCRFDKLKPNATIDLKSFSNWQGREFHKAMLREAAIREYPVQSAHYEEGRRRMRELVAAGKVFTPPHLADRDAKLALLQEISRAEIWRWVWVFYKTDGAPRAKGVIMDWRGKHSPIMNLAIEKRREALSSFLAFRERFGLSHESPMWADTSPLWEPEAEDFPAYAQIVD